MSLDFTKDKPTLKPRDTLEPKLRTSAAPKRPADMRQAIAALVKRNLADVRSALPGNLRERSKLLVEHMLDTFGVADWKEKSAEFRLNPLRPNNVNIEDWVNAQTETTVKSLKNAEFDFDELEIEKFKMILKGDTKPDVSTKVQTTRPQPQIIMHHDKNINAVFGPIYRAAFDRLLTLLRGNVLVNKSKSIDKLEADLANVAGDCAFDPDSADYPFDDIANDFSDYDKGQGQEVYAAEMYMCELMGMDVAYMRKWYSGHVTTSNVGFDIGVALWLIFQRKSGDVTTSFGNTLANMVACAWGYKLTDFVFALFLGDDSLIRVKKHTVGLDAMRKGPRIILDAMNLTAKVDIFRRGYFCGYVLCWVDGRLKLVCDPIRRIARLGRWDIKGEQECREHHISYCDLLRNYESVAALEEMGKGMNELYPKMPWQSFMHAGRALYTLKNDYSEYRKFWTWGPTHTEY